MTIDTPRLVIRPFTLEDAASLQEILGDEQTMVYSEPPYSPEKTIHFLKTFCIRRQGALAVQQKDSGKVIGYLLFSQFDPGVYEAGWFFNRRYWRQGFAYEACKALFAYAFDTLQAHKIFAETIDPNGSVGLMEKLGMVREGIQRSHTRDSRGNWVDVYHYGLLKEDL